MEKQNGNQAWPRSWGCNRRCAREGGSGFTRSKIPAPFNFSDPSDFSDDTLFTFKHPAGARTKMKPDKTAAVFVVISAVGLCAIRPARAAGLIASVSYNQYLDVDGLDLGTVFIQSLSGTSLPVSASATASIPGDSGGPLITANYNFTDNGTVAQFNIQTSGRLTDVAQEVYERSNRDIGFTLTAPASFTALETTTVNALSATEFISMGSGPFNNDLNIFDLNGFNTTLTYSGTLSAGVPYLFNENWGLGNNEVANPVGTDSGDVTLTLTAIPEPSSFCLIAVTGAGLLSLRRTRSSPPT